MESALSVIPYNLLVPNTTPANLLLCLTFTSFGYPLLFNPFTKSIFLALFFFSSNNPFPIFSCCSCVF